jgi:PPM family protein phosphatase
MLCLKCNFKSQDAEEFCPNCGAALAQIQNPLGLNKLSVLLAGTIAGGKYRIASSGTDSTGRLYEAICLANKKKVILEKAELTKPKSPIEKGDEPESAQAIETNQSTQGQISVDYDYAPPVSLRERCELLNSLGNTEYPKVYDYFTSGSTEYLILEPPDGKDLIAFLAENNINEDLTLDIILGLCERIKEIHHLGYLHLNIEPGNIYLSNGQVRLFDFSRTIKQGTIMKNYLTNEGFSPPELMLPDGAAIDDRADIYSIGAVMLWMLSGEKLTLAGMSLSKIVSSVSSPELARILLSCLAADVNSRYRTVSELRDRLQAYRALSNWSFRYDSASLTDVGMARMNNEDACLSLELALSTELKTDSYGIYLVADGMGGHAAGEVASAKALETISSSILDAVNSRGKGPSFSEVVKNAIEKANSEIYNMAQRNPHQSSMGTTVTLGLRVNNELYLGHVGDSRCYLARDGKITRLTHDHSVVGGLLEREMITPKQAKLHPDRGKIYRCLGSESEVAIDTCETTGYGEKLMLAGDDKLVFCSDGLANNVSDEEILECVEKGEDAHTVCRDLVRLVNVKGGDDNITVIAVRVVGKGK